MSPKNRVFFYTLLDPSEITVDGVSGDRLPLPKCSYVNTDFPGDDLDVDLGDGEGPQRGVNAGSARSV